MNLIKIIQKNKSMQMWQGKEKQHLKEKKREKKKKRQDLGITTQLISRNEIDMLELALKNPWMNSMLGKKCPHTNAKNMTNAKY